MEKKKTNAKTKPFKFANADELKQAAEGYFTWADNNPVRLPYSQKMKGNADEKEPTGREQRNEYATRPYLLQELAHKIGVGNWANFKRDNREREGFAEVIADIENRVASQQLTGAMVGMYRENLVARLNGLAEQVLDVTPPPCTIEITEEE